MYARADNFVGSVLYDDLRQAYLHPEAAAALVKAQKRLKQLHPELSLKIYDAARPMHIQQKMWNGGSGALVRANSGGSLGVIVFISDTGTSHALGEDPADSLARLGWSADDATAIPTLWLALVH